MFEVLPESAAPRAPRAWGSRVASLAVHAALIGAALHLTDGQAQPPTAHVYNDTTIFIPQDETRRPAAPPPGGDPVVSPGPPRPQLPVFVDVPAILPPVGDPMPSFAWTGADTGSVFTRDTTAGAPGGLGLMTPLDARLADEAPRLLDHPPLRYPEVMRQAGVEGRVVIEAVLDTTGRVERGSLRTIIGVHDLFDDAARDVVAASRYQPARHGGRAVRVRIQVPVAFTLQR